MGHLTAAGTGLGPVGRWGRAAPTSVSSHWSGAVFETFDGAVPGESEHVPAREEILPGGPRGRLIPHGDVPNSAPRDARQPVTRMKIGLLRHISRNWMVFPGSGASMIVVPPA